MLLHLPHHVADARTALRADRIRGLQHGDRLAQETIVEYTTLPLVVLEVLFGFGKQAAHGSSSSGPSDPAMDHRSANRVNPRRGRAGHYQHGADGLCKGPNSSGS